MEISDPVCIIPARGTSPGLPKKNFKQIGGKPLVAHIIESALNSSSINKVFVSTESEDLAEISRQFGARVPFLRPKMLSNKNVLLTEVIQHALGELEDRSCISLRDDTPVVILQPNVPFTKSRDIDRGVKTFRRDPTSAVISVVEEHDFFWEATQGHLTPLHEARILREELNPLYRESGSIYITNKTILKEGSRVGDEPAYVLTDKLSAFEVDSLYDVWLAEKVHQGPSILFRVDGGGEVGMGHIYRCLTLADEVRNRLNCEVTFLSDSAYEGGVKKIEEHGFEVVPYETERVAEAIHSLDPDIVILDVLDTKAEDIRALHDASAAIINLEDLGGGLEQADFVVNALYEYVGDGANQLFGADYLILRDEFVDKGFTVRSTVENVLLTFGGSDPQNFSTALVQGLLSRELPYEYRLILGPDFGHDDPLRGAPAADRNQIQVLEDVSNMAEQMAWADVAICSGGRTVYELAAMGTPAIVIAQNEREASRMEELDRRGIVRFVGEGLAFEAETVVDELLALADDFSGRVVMSRKGQEFVDGKGVRRVIDLLHDILIA